MEAILAHELAHIRRHDYLVNLLQVVIETALFYHPAVWWVSRRIRIERENCCDDLAIQLCGDRFGYIRALVSLEELRNAPVPALAVAWQGTSLLDRARRLLGVPTPHVLQSSRWMAGPAVLVGGLVAAAILLVASPSKAESQADAPKKEASATQVSESSDNRATPARWQRYAVKKTRTSKDGDDIQQLTFLLPKEYEAKTSEDATSEVRLQTWFIRAMVGTDLSGVAKILGKAPASRPSAGKGSILRPGEHVVLSDEQLRELLTAAKRWGVEGTKELPRLAVSDHGTAVGSEDMAGVEGELAELNGQDKSRFEVMGDFRLAAKAEITARRAVKLDCMLHIAERGGPGAGKGGSPVLMQVAGQAAAEVPARSALVMPASVDQVKLAGYRKRGTADKAGIDIYMESVPQTQAFMAWFVIIRPAISKAGGSAAQEANDDEFVFDTSPEQRLAGELNAKVAQIDIATGTLGDILRVFGEPNSYAWGNEETGEMKVFTQDNLPDYYCMTYPGGFRVFMANGEIQELRFEGDASYIWRGGLHCLSSLEDVLAVVGQPTRTVVGEPISWEDGVLYKDVEGQTGQGYYSRQDQGVRMFFRNNKVVALYLTRPLAATDPAFPNPAFNATIGAKVAQFRINDAKRKDVIQTFGEPLRYMGDGYKRVKETELPESYQMEYPGGFSVYVAGQEVQELRFDSRAPQNPAVFAYKGQLRVGSTIEEALQVMGPPDRVVEGQKLGFEEGVLYKDIGGRKGEGYYQRYSQGVRVFTRGNRVNALYLPRTGPSAEEAAFRAQVGQKLANVDLSTWTYNDVIAALGEPRAVYPDRQKISSGKQSSEYKMVYSGVWVNMDGERIKDISIGASSYLYRGKITVDTPEQTVFEVLGQPREVRIGQPDDGTDGVLYKDYLADKDVGGASLYRRADQGIVLYLHNAKVMSMKLVPTRR